MRDCPKVYCWLEIQVLVSLQGKTLLAKALAGESNCNFYYISASMIESKYVGSGAANIRSLFAEARKNSPSIVFFDEFDSIAGKRNASGGANNVSRNTINELLNEIDGFKKNEKVFVVGSTNFPQSLDPAILRPGRFDKILKIPKPTVKGRQKILEHYLKKVQHDSDLDVRKIAKGTLGSTGSDLKTLINLSILNAVKNGREKANQADFDHAIDRLNVGIINKSMKATEQEKYMTAVHEAGHTLASLLSKHSTPLNKVTILSKGHALGYTNQFHFVHS